MHEYVKYADGTLAVFSDIRKKDNGEEYIIVSFERPKEYDTDTVIFELPSCNIVKKDGHYTDDEIAIFKTVVERRVGYFFNAARKEKIPNDKSPITNKYKIITLCGSIKFKDEFMELQEKLALDGNIVLIPNFFNSIKKEDIDEKTKKMLDEMHKQKIDMSDEIYVINVGGYIGESTKSEIEYAKSKGKKISYLEGIK